jgi:hypothetical protein
VATAFYTYVVNIDPSGHWFWAAIVAIFKAFVTYAAAHPFITGAVVGGIQGGINAGIQGTNIFEGMVRGAGIGWATGGVMSIIPGGGTFSENLLLNMTYHSLRGAAIGSVTGGVMSALSGGRFSEGARFGAITGGITGAIGGFMSSEQFGNWVQNDKFMTNTRFSAYRSMRLGFEELTSGQTDVYGKFGIGAGGAYNKQYHAGTFLTTPEGTQAWGKYPAFEASSEEMLLGKSGPAQIVPESGFFSRDDISVFGTSVTQVQATAYNEYVNTALSNPGRFALTTNCADWALGAARYMGIFVPDNLRTFTYTDPGKIQKWIDSYAY